MNFGTAWVVGAALIGMFLTILSWFISAIVKSMSEKRKGTDAAIDDLRESHNKLEISVAKDYISVETFRLFEQRLVDTLKALGVKVDTLLSRPVVDNRRRSGDE